MTYLELVNDFLLETGMEDPIATVTGQIDDAAQAVMWVRDAWTEIQRGEDWTFLWAEGSFNTVAAQRVYTLAEQNLVSGDKPIQTSYWNNTTDGRIDPVSRTSIQRKTDQGIPRQIAFRPDSSVILAHVPDGIYEIGFEYHCAPKILTLDGESPAVDPAYHKAIVWKAIVNYAREQGKEWQGLYVTANREFETIYSDMLIEYLPPYLGKRPLC